jgi:hypothetical protein
MILACILGVGGLYFIGTQVAPKKGIATITPFPGTTPGATILFQDPLTSNTGDWVNDTNCFFQDSAYHIKDNFVCFAHAGNISDANITVQAKQVAGSLREPYGISFRKAATNAWYDFDITSDSEWFFGKVVNGKEVTLIHYTRNAAIKGGLNTSNTLLVQAKDSHFVFYVNGTKVGQADDATYTSGLVGLSAGGSDTEIAYNNFQITKAD